MEKAFDRISVMKTLKDGIKKGYKPEEPKNNHPASRVFTAERGFE